MKTRKILACLLAMCMILSVVGTTAFAASVFYDGSNMTVDSEVYPDFKNDFGVAPELQIDGKPAALSLSNNHKGIGGKADDDVCYKVMPADTSLISQAFLYPFIRYVGSKDDSRPTFASMDVLFDDSNVVFEIWKYTSFSTNYNDKAEIGKLRISESKGLDVLSGGMITVAENAPKSLSSGQWHNVAVEVGDTYVKAFIDGKEYVCTIPSGYYGTCFIRPRFYSTTRNTYFDNYVFGIGKFTQAATPATVSVKENKDAEFSAADKKFSVYNSELTAAELKSYIETDGTVRIYTDSTYKTLMDNDSAVNADTVVVVESVSGAFRYYKVEITKCDFSSEGVNKGDEEVYLNQPTDGTTFTPGIAGNGGKLSDDVSLKISTSGGHGGQNFIEAYGVEGVNCKGTLYFEISVQAPERGAIAAQYATYTTDAHSDYNSTNPAIWAVSSDAVTVADTKVCDAVPGRWYTLAAEIKGGGSTEAAAYVNGVKYDIKLNAPSYGVRHFRIYPVEASEAYDAYYDNIRYYSSATRKYNVDADKETTLSANTDAISIYSEGIVYADKQAVYTAGELRAMLKTDAASQANIRIYSDKTFTKLLGDDEDITNDSVVVVAATNGCDIERVYSYYPVNPAINTTIFDFKVISKENKTAKITGFYEKNIKETDDLSAISIPEEILGYTITEIGTGAFYQNRVIQSLVIPDTVIAIGASAFGDAGVSGQVQGKLTSVKLSANLKEIGTGAFSANPITKIEFPEGLESIGDTAFYWTSIREISLPDSLTYLGKNAFRLTPVKYLKLSAGIKEYKASQFLSSSTAVDDLVIPAGVEYIGPDVFRDTTEGANGEITDNTAEMKNTVVHGVAGTYAQAYAAKYGFAFKAAVANTIVTQPAIYGDGSKAIEGTDYDISYGYKDLIFKAKLVNMGKADVDAIAMLVLYDTDGAIIAKDIEDVKIQAGKTVSIDETTGDGGVSIDVDELRNDYTVKAFIWRKSNIEPICPAVEFTFDETKREMHVLLIANSFGNDSFGNINDIAKADGVVLRVQNMYIGGAPLTSHYKNMSQNLFAYTPVINGVYGVEKSESVDSALRSGKWDVVALQCATHGFSSDYSFVDYQSWADDEEGSMTGTPTVTTTEMYDYIKKYVQARAPQAKRVMHMSWSPCEAQAEVMYDARFKDAENAREEVFELQKDAYLYGSSIFADEEGMMVPSSYAMQYALDKLGFKEHSGTMAADRTYPNPVAGEVSIYRDETCHLTMPYGRVLAGLTWYEYLTGNDARENPYQNEEISEDIMAKLKEAAHWANTQVVPLTGSAE